MVASIGGDEQLENIRRGLVNTSSSTWVSRKFVRAMNDWASFWFTKTFANDLSQVAGA